MSVICFHFLVNTPNDMCCSMCFKSVDAFLEEMIIRRELADNFCFYQPHYDNIRGARDWARKTLMDHAADKREHIYTWAEMIYLRLLVLFTSLFHSRSTLSSSVLGCRQDELEKAKTDDPVSSCLLSNSFASFLLEDFAYYSRLFAPFLNSLLTWVYIFEHFVMGC